MLSGEPRQGRIGIGYATLWASRDLPASDTPRLSLIEIDAAFTELKAIKGAGSAGTRNERLRELLRQATRAEQDFIVRLLIRRAAARGTRRRSSSMRSPGQPTSAPPPFRRAVMMAGTLAPVAQGGTRCRRSRARLASASGSSARSSRCWRSPATTSPRALAELVPRRSSGSSMARAFRCTRGGRGGRLHAQAE